jgi:hypothetical protein
MREEERTDTSWWFGGESTIMVDVSRGWYKAGAQYRGYSTQRVRTGPAVVVVYCGRGKVLDFFASPKSRPHLRISIIEP